MGVYTKVFGAGLLVALHYWYSSFLTMFIKNIIFHFSLCNLVPPTIMPFQFGGDSLEAGQMGQLNCIVLSGDTPLHFTWSFHGKASTTNKQTGVSTMKLGERSSMLMIESVSSEHSGTFCSKRSRQFVIFCRT